MCSVLAGLTALTGYMQYEGQRRAIMSQAEAQAAAYRAQAETDQRNAQLKNREQEQVADNYARQAEELRQRRRIVEGQQRAQAGSAGLGMGGSMLDLLSAGTEAYNQDKMTLLTNQRNDNFNKRLEETNYLNSAEGNRVAARNTMRQAEAQVSALRGSTILGTAASIIGMGSFGGGGSAGAASGNVATSVSSKVGTNTMANWSLGTGYNFSRINNYGKTLMPKTYF